MLNMWWNNHTVDLLSIELLLTTSHQVSCYHACYPEPAAKLFLTLPWILYIYILPELPFTVRKGYPELCYPELGVTLNIYLLSNATYLPPYHPQTNQCSFGRLISSSYLLLDLAKSHGIYAYLYTYMNCPARVRHLYKLRVTLNWDLLSNSQH